MALSRPDLGLIAKLVDQIIDHAERRIGKPDVLYLTADEIDAWRAQFRGQPPPVELLAFRGIRIVERNPTGDPAAPAPE